MAPVCRFYRFSPQQFWGMRVRDLADLIDHMAAVVEENERQERAARVRAAARAKAGASGRS